MATISSLIQENNQLTIQYNNTGSYYINALRRVILSDIPALNFPNTSEQVDEIQEDIIYPLSKYALYKYYNKLDNIQFDCGKFDIVTNNTFLQNERIISRIQQIPVYIKMEDFLQSPNDYIFEINYTNDHLHCENQIITTDDIQFSSNSSFSHLSTSEQRTLLQHIFPPYHVYDQLYSPLTILFLAPKQSIHILLQPHLITPNQTSTCQLVCQCYFTNNISNENVQNERTELLKKTNSDELLDKMHEFDTLTTYQLYQKDSLTNQANSFTFIIESIGYYSVCCVLESAYNCILTKLQMFASFILPNAMISISHENNHNNSEIYEILIMDKLVMENLTINCNLNHTIGSLLSGYIYEKYFCQSQQVIFVSYNKKHNSDQCIYLYLTLSNYLNGNNKEDEIREFILKCIGELIVMIESNKNVFIELTTKNE